MQLLVQILSVRILLYGEHFFEIRYDEVFVLTARLLLTASCPD
ncbi:MAG TPA: hypothetical protein VLE22_06090 [Bryobacteraceae bacterium]|nr:hypothetical protein [Bryobacteraceae bacterium]